MLYEYDISIYSTLDKKEEFLSYFHYLQSILCNYEKYMLPHFILQKNYNTLEQERGQIMDLITQYETLNSAHESGVINVTSNYYKYILYIIIAIFLIILLIKFSLSGEQRGGGNSNKISPFIFCILACIIVFNAILKINY